MTNAEQQHDDGRFSIRRGAHVIRIKELIAGIGLGRSTIYQLVKDGALPPPFKLGRRAVGWLESDIAAFIASRVTASRIQEFGSDVAPPIDSRIGASRSKLARPTVITASRPQVAA